MLYSDNSALMVLGHLLNRPSILLSDKYKLENTDFIPNEFNRVMFWAIRNVTMQGAKEIDEVAIDSFLQNDEARYNLAKKNDFMGFIRNAKDLAKVDDFDYHYNVLKKYSLLRFYKGQGIDISKFYNEDFDEKEKLDEYELEDIVKYFDNINNKAKKQFLVNSDIEEIKAGYKMHEIVEEFTKTPMLGATTPSLYYNTITRGLIKGQLNIMSCPTGCVDKDTEYFNGHEWKSIDMYTEDEKVLQYNKNGSAELVDPLRYVKAPCNEMWHFETRFGINQTLSDEHRIIFKTTKKDLQECSMKKMRELHNNSIQGFGGKFITTFDYEGNGINLTKEEIRVMCAVICDGSFSKSTATTRCKFHLKKERKQKRLRQLFKDANIEWKETIDEKSHSIHFYANVPRREKEFTSYWYNCNKIQLKTICDEVMFWDGTTQIKRKNISQKFSTTIKQSADFIQFAFSSCGYRATLSTQDRRGKIYKHNDKIYTYKCIEYIVIVSSNLLVGLRSGKKPKITKYYPLDGYKYCFTVPSHMLVLRRKGRIFITGNSGKTTWCLANIAKIGCPMLYDNIMKEWIRNPSYVNEGVLFIDYEQNQLYETSPKLLGSISKVPTGHILNGTYYGDERERVEKAIDVLNDSKIYMINMPNFTMGALEAYIQDYVLNYDIGYLFFDYLSEQASINSEVATRNKVTTRADMVLSTMSSFLKDMAVKYSLAVMTFTQTNVNIYNQKIVDSNCVAGSRATINKADYASVMMPLRPEEQDVCQTIIEAQRQSGKKIIDIPNRLIFVHKIRFGTHEPNLKVWIHLDLSTGDVTDCWVTDKNNEPYDIEKTELKNNS